MVYVKFFEHILAGKDRHTKYKDCSSCGLQGLIFSSYILILGSHHDLLGIFGTTHCHSWISSIFIQYHDIGKEISLRNAQLSTPMQE